MRQPIELRRLRDFGQTINDSFTFLKENFKPLFKSLLIICSFFILVSIVSTIYTYITAASLANGDININTNSYEFRSRSVTVITTALVSAFTLVLTQAFITLTTLCYISVYLQKNNETPELAEVWGYFKYYFWRVLGSGILIFFLLMIGTMLCLIPGIYLAPILYLIIPIIVIENSSFRYAFNASFRLIKNHWWLVFGVIFIMSLIVGLGGSIINIPISLFMKGSMFLSLKTFTLPLVIIFSVFRGVLLLAYVLPSIAICLCYFNLSEEKDGTGLLNRIGKLGKIDDSQSISPAEEF